MADVISDTLVVFCVSSLTDLREHHITNTCKKWLPPYMVPTDVLIMEAMPYLASGKVDRRTLQGLHQQYRESQEPPSDTDVDETIRRLAQVLSEILKVDVLSLPTLSAAGIDSLTSIRVASRLRSHGYPLVNATDILEARSLSELQQRLGGQDETQQADGSEMSLLQDHAVRSVLESHALLSFQMNKIQDIVRCSPVQSAMLSETIKDPNAYCNWIELQVDAEKSMADVKKAVLALTAHHEMLRTGFAVLNNAQHPYASIIWKDGAFHSTVQVTKLHHDFAIKGDTQLLEPRPIQICGSRNGTSVLFQLHHSLYDQWSLDVIKEDLDQLLQGTNLSPRPSYTAVTAFHAQHSDQAKSEAETEYWQAHLRDTAATPLPQLNPKKQPPGLQRSAWVPISISTASLRQKATHLNVSAPAVFQAAYAYLLSMYVGASDVMYGSVFSGRQIPVHEVERIVGPCLATLPSRVDISGMRTVQDLVRAVHGQNRSILKHSATPLAEVKKIGQFAPNEAMFDTLFVWQESTFAKPLLVTEVGSADKHELNLVLEVEPQEDKITVRVTYQQNRISANQVEIFTEQLQSLVQILLDDANTSLLDLPTALPNRIMAIDNPQPTSHSHRNGLIAVLEEVAEREPSSPALVFAESFAEPLKQFQSLSYGDMHAKANKLARYLVSRGVEPDDLVCICMEKSIDLYVTILAVIKSGAGYLPVLPDTPKDRLSSILEQTSPRLFLCDNGMHEDVCSETTTTAAQLTKIDLTVHSGANLDLPYNGSNAAYSIFTSGSTGTPKGLVVTQDNLLSNLSALADIYPVAQGDRLLQACSQAFDVSVFEIFFAFFTGIPLCFARKDELFQDIEHGIRALEGTHLSLTPTVAALVDPKNVPTVRFLVTAGEAMTDVVHRKWAGKGLHQGYGPSETTNICTVNPQMPSSDIISNIGPAFPNTSAFVIDPNRPFCILPFGAVGEFAFGGEQVFRGYIGRDELNAEKIIAHPEYGRVYRSGDIGRMLPGGTMLISGRLDDQVKVRGNRIELGEINATLLSQAWVEDCTTIVLGKVAASQSIASFWIPANSTAQKSIVFEPTSQLQQQVAELYRKLEDSLPPYMIPTSIIPVTALPRTTQGKLDRRRLELAASTLSGDAKNIYSRSAGQTTDEEGEWTSTERRLADALANVIRVPLESVGRSTSFFALGLNSINAISYAKTLAKDLGRVVSVGAILRNASVARLARSLPSQVERSDDMTAQLPAIFSQGTIDAINERLGAESHKAVAYLPCTPLQEAMLSAGSSQTDAIYSNRTTFKINGSMVKLKECFLTLVRRHATLRTRFFETSDSDHPFAQVVLNDIDLPWSEHETSPEVNGSHGIDERTSPVTQQCPFLVSTEDTEDATLLTLCMHHAIYDGTSMSVLLEEVQSLYQEYEILPAPVFEPFLREVQDHSGADAMTFWSSRFSDYHAKPFPAHAGNASTHGRIQLPLEISTSDVDSFSKRHNISATSLFQAAWVKVLAIAQTADDVCFGDVVSGRSVPVADIDRLVAPCFNTLPVRISLGDVYDNLGLVRHLHNQRLSAHQYQLSPLRRIQAQSKTPEAHLFDSLLLVQPPTQDLNNDIWELREDEGLMDLPLVVEVRQGLTHSELVVHSSGEYFSEETASIIADAYVKSLEACVRFPSSNVREITAISEHLEGFLATKLIPEAPSHANDDGTTPETWTGSETQIRQAFGHFANIDVSKIRRNTSLYRLGLDSLNAVQVASRLRSKGMSVTAADVMEHRTPAALAAAVTAKPARDQPGEVVGIDLAKYDGDHRSNITQSLNIAKSSLGSIRPCTPAQNGMISQSLQTKGALYVNHIAYGVPQDASVQNLRSAWQGVQRKHQALRMGFAETDEAHCPFAMLIYRDGEMELPFKEGTFSEAEIGAAVVSSMHLPAWRVTVGGTLSNRTMTLAIHHALYDAESLQVLLRDFSLAIQHKDIGTCPSIDGLLHPMITGTKDVGAEAESFWRNTLENSSPTTFPSLHPTISTASGLCSVEQASSLSYSTLENLCKSAGCTIQAAGQSAWAVLLSAYLGEAGVTFGTVFSGRAGSQHDPVVFPSLTTLPVFCDASKKASDLLSSMTDFNGAAQKYRHVPLSDIQRFADMPGQPLFDTVFVYQKSTGSAADDFSWPLLSQSAAVDYNVSIELETTPTGEVSLRLTANRGVLPEDHGSLILAQYDHLLGQILHADRASSSSPPSLFSATPARCPRLPSPVQLLHQFVEEGAQSFPDRPALEFAWGLDASSNSRKIWSYQQLEKQANQVAHLLQANGAASGDIVAVCMNKCPEASFAFVGILKAGCAFLALDPELPPARKEFILEDSGAKILLVDSSADINDGDFPTRVIELNNDALNAYPTSPVSGVVIDAQATCYCLYTSGTTGTPKGCELTHENAVQAMMSFQKLFAGRWNDKSRWLQFASYWFDVSVLEQFWSWSVGITLVGAPRDLVLDDITSFIQTLHITHIDLTPSLARLLEPEDVPSLWDGVFITGGEALKQEIIEKWGSHRTICNGYGPTEATIGVTMNPFIGPDAKASNIGPAFLNVGSYVFAPGTTTPVLRGAVGELCVSGKLVGKGYLNRPELTAKAFPRIKDTGEKIYRTGDLVRQVVDGSFLFIGRQDSQAKLRGQRLEIDEIDSVIKSSSDEIADYASLVIKGGEKETLVTFFITEVRKQTPEVLLEASEQARTIARIAYESCRAHLPGYMVPTHILPLNIIPLTVNNKIDAKRLNAFYNKLSVSDIQSVKGEQTGSQRLGADAKKLCQVLKRLLLIDTSQVDNSTNVFSLGMSSVSAITFASLLKRAGFASANVALIMRNPVIGQLADALTQSAGDSQDQDLVRQAQMSMAAFDRRYRASAASRLGVEFDNIEVVAPCTPLQQGLVLESIKGDERPYFNEFRFVANDLDAARLQHAFQQVADLVQPLRTKFMQTDDGYSQVILRHHTIRWHQEDSTQQDLGAMTAEYRMQWLERNEVELTSPFEIVLAGSSSAKYLFVYIHHALYDGASFELLMEQVSRAYNKQTIDCGPKFTDALPYGPLGGIKDANLFWEHHFGESSDGNIHSIPDPSSNSDPVEQRAVGTGTTLDKICKNLGVSHQAVMQACFSVALHQFAPNVNTYGVIVSGRSFAFEGADQILGPLFNTIPSPSGLQTDDTWLSLIQRCHAFNAAVLPHQHTPLRDIKKWCKFAPSDPVFDALFVFQNTRTTRTPATNPFWEPISDKPRAEYPLAFEVELDAQGTLAATIVAKRNVATESALQRLLQSFDQALRLLEQGPDQPIAKSFHIAANLATNGQRKDTAAEDAPYLNGVHDFSWTAEAQKLRSEIAKIASLEEHEIDEHSTIFSLGLDSIDAVKLASRLKRSGMAISVSKLLRAQTIPRILSSLQENLDNDLANEKISLLAQLQKQLPNALTLPKSFDSTQIERILPATPSQEALMAEMVRSDFLEYYNHDVLQLRPNIAFEELRSAWTTIARNLPILRTSFIEVSSPEIDAVYAQVVHKFNGLDFSHIELDDLSELDGVLENIRNDVRKSISVSPPTRLTFVQVGSERYLLLSLAHAQYDGHSLALLHQDVERAYSDSSVDSRPSPDLVIDASLAAVDSQALAFWRNNLSGAQICRMPQAKPNDTSATLHRVEDVSSVTTSEARSFCRNGGFSMQTLAQTSWALTLAHYVRRLEVVFGAVLACRDSEEAEQIMFPMMNTVPVRATLHGSRKDMLKHMQDVSTDVLAYQRTPLRFIQSAAAGVVESSDINDTSDGHGLFDTLFIYQHRPDQTGQQTEPLYDSVGGSSNIEYPVAVEVEAVGERLILRAACKHKFFNDDRAQDLLRSLNQALEAIVRRPDEPTVTFRGSQSSICGLPFTICQTESVAMTSKSEEASDDDASSLSGEAITIRDVLCQVSKTPPEELSPSSTIESIGIDSISAIKVVALLRKQGVKLSVGELIRAKTVGRMAKVVQDRTVDSTPDQIDAKETIAVYTDEHRLADVLTVHGIDGANVQSVLPALPGQIYMLNVWQTTHGQLFYPTFTYRFTGRATLGQLQGAWQALVREHDALRTAFCATGDLQNPVCQVVLKKVPESFSSGDDQPVSPSQQPMARLRVEETSSSWTLKLTIHHALYDAISLPLLMEDFAAFVAGRSPTPSPISQTDFLALSLTPSAQASRKRFWTDYLNGAKPVGLQQPELDTAQDRVEIFNPGLLPATSNLETVARKENLTPQSILFAAHARSYARTASKSPTQDHVVLGIYLSNRSHIEHLPALRSPTLNLVPLLVRSAGTTPLLKSARQIQHDLRLIGSAENSAVGLWEIADWTGVRVDTFVNFLRLPSQAEENEDDREGYGGRFEAVEDQRLAARSQVTPAKEEERARFCPPKALPPTQDGVRDVHLVSLRTVSRIIAGAPSIELMSFSQHSLDLEATITPDGTLDVGLFCPASMVGLPEAEVLLQDLKRELQSVGV